MKKKTLAFILAAAMALTLAACGGSPAGSEPPTSTPTPANDTPAPESSASGSTGAVYTTVINEAEVTITIADDQKSVVVDVMGMTVEGTCEVSGSTLTMKELTSGNAQIWAGLAANPYTLNDDGTATAAGASGQEPGGEGTATGVARFAGEYDLYSKDKDMYCEEFIIDEDGTVHGVVESSGLTSFEGTVSEDGTITAEVTRLGGTMNGTITDDLQVTVHFEVRGSTSDFVGGPL